jgi:hypothetical protein
MPDPNERTFFKNNCEFSEDDIKEAFYDIVQKVTPDTIETEQPTFVWNVDYPLINTKSDSETGSGERKPSTQEQQTTFDSRRLEVISAALNVIPDHVGRVNSTAKGASYKTALVFKNYIVFESDAVGMGAYFVPLVEPINNSLEGKSEEEKKEELKEIIEPYLGRSKKELRNEFGAKHLVHPDHNLPDDDFEDRMAVSIQSVFEALNSDDAMQKDLDRFSELGDDPTTS